MVHNRLDRRPEQRIFRIAGEHESACWHHVPLASGYLSGKYKPGATFPASDVRARHKQAVWSTRNSVKYEKIRREEVPPGVNMAEWALAWCLQHPAVSCVIPGCKDVHQVITDAGGEPGNGARGSPAGGWRLNATAETPSAEKTPRGEDLRVEDGAKMASAALRLLFSIFKHCSAHFSRLASRRLH